MNVRALPSDLQAYWALNFSPSHVAELVDYPVAQIEDVFAYLEKGFNDYVVSQELAK